MKQSLEVLTSKQSLWILGGLLFGMFGSLEGLFSGLLEELVTLGLQGGLELIVVASNLSCCALVFGIGLFFGLLFALVILGEFEFANFG